MKFLLAFTGFLASVWLLAFLLLRHLRESAEKSAVKKLKPTTRKDICELRREWEEAGVPKHLQEEWETAEADLDIEGPPPGFTERLMQKIKEYKEYEERLTKICDLKKDDVIQMGDLRHAFDTMFDATPMEYHLFVVLEVTTTGFFVEVIVGQLNDDGTYDPDGRKVLLADNTNGERRVELVGRMNPVRSRANPPKED